MEKALNVLKDLCIVINFNSYWKPRVEEAIAELQEAMKPKTCEWQYNEFDEAWDGKCGVKFVINFDTPKANNMNFCPKCGGKLIETDPKDNA